ncbi:MAG: hypothetical protein GF331_02675 [Chitinivibrionales bacterium]|nr:hypothetical protein [Chitinivibrionales bacterium]
MQRDHGACTKQIEAEAVIGPDCRSEVMEVKAQGVRMVFLYRWDDKHSGFRQVHQASISVGIDDDSVTVTDFPTPGRYRLALLCS